LEYRVVDGLHPFPPTTGLGRQSSPLPLLVALLPVLLD
jgi:hypothetical protein